MDASQSPLPTTNRLSPEEQAELAARLQTPTQKAAAQSACPAIPGYEIVRELGRGGMGVVYQARQTRLNRLVAIKMILAGAYAGEQERLRFQREAEALARLQHPNIVQIFEIGEHEGHAFLALEYVEGGSLARWLGGRPIPGRSAAGLVETLARAVHHAHERDIVHRDLKPANVLVSGEGLDTSLPLTTHHSPRLKITDFGLAKQVDLASGPTQSGAVMGTPSHMAPEQAAGQIREIGPRTDVYALGVILYEMLTGHVPFHGATPLETLDQVRYRDPVPPSRLQARVHRDLETICLKALAKEPLQRYCSALALAEDLAHFQAGDAITARREPLVRKMWRRARRQPVRFVAAPALVLLILVAVALGWRAYAASREKELIQALNAGMEGPWTRDHLEQTEAAITDLARWNPDQADDARRRLHQALAASIRESYSVFKKPVLEAVDLAAIHESLDLLKSRDSELARELRADFEKRLAQMQRVAHLEPPFDKRKANELFVPAIEVVGDSLIKNGSADALVALTHVRCQGDVEIVAEFDPSWESATEIGVLLHAQEGVGYEFLLRTTSAALAGDRSVNANTPTFQEGRAAGGTMSLQIRRRGRLLREHLIDAPKLRPGSLRLQASRRHGLLSFRVNDLPELQFHTAFLPASREPGVFGLYWPSSVRLTRLECFRQSLPANPSPLEKADSLYDLGKFDDALVEFRRQGQSATLSKEVRSEVAYKETLCLVRLGRFEEAAKILESLAYDGDQRWSASARLQLALCRIRQNQLKEAALLLQSLAAPANTGSTGDTTLFGAFDPRSRLDQLAAMIPEDQFDDLWQTLKRRYLDNQINIFFYDFTQARGLVELLAAIRDGLPLQFKPQDRVLLQFCLTSIYWYGSDKEPEWTERAAQAAADMIDHEGEASDRTSLHLAPIGFYCDVLARAGRAREALARIDARLQRDPTAYQLLWVYRGRLHAALRDFQEADRDLDRLFASDALISYATYSDAWLLRGFLREREGNGDAAANAWRQGLYKAYLHSRWRSRQPTPVGAHAFSGGLRGLVLASLVGELSESDWSELFAHLSASFPKDTLGGAMLPMFRHAVSPDVLVRIFGRPQGRDYARQLAFHDFSLRTAIRQPLLLFAVEAMRTAFPNAEVTAEQETALWELAGKGHDRYFTGATNYLELARSLGVPLFAVWNDNQGDFLAIVLFERCPKGIEAWKDVESKLHPDVRASLAYLFGCKYLHVHHKPDAAAVLFRSAVANAPPGSPLQRLAQAELDRMPGK